MSSHAIVSKYLIDMFNSDELVNTVLYGSLDERSLAKNDIFPLVHITPTQTNYLSNEYSFNFINFSFEIAVVDIRYLGNKFSNPDEVFKDNLIDNLNTCNQIIVNAISKMRSGNTSDDIFLETVSAADPLMFQDVHLLDGWVFNIEINIPNNYSSC